MKNNARNANAVMNALHNHREETIKSSELRKIIGYPISNLGSMTFANKLGLIVIDREKCAKGYTLTFNTAQVIKQFSKKFNIECNKNNTNKRSVNNQITIDDVLRDFNATIDAMHHDDLDRHDEVIEKMNQIMNALKSLFARQELLSNQQKMILEKFNESVM